MHRQLTDFIFLTGKEIKIHGRFYLTVHLARGSARERRLERLCADGGSSIKLVVYDPVIKRASFLQPGLWYIIPTVAYTGRSDSSGTANISFSYDQGPGRLSRGLTEREVRDFRENNQIAI